MTNPSNSAANCRLCPRRCGAPRTETSGAGLCRMGTLPVLARAAAHIWEEPCISGTRGSGTVFLSGCPLQCVFCQNREISAGGFGRRVSIDRLRKIYGELAASGVHNINLVTPTHFAPAIAASLQGGVGLPVVWNTSGYESVETLKTLEGLVQIYLPDMKFACSAPAAKYSGAPDYPEVAKAAILEMFRQTGPYVLDDDGILQRGTVIRHLILPGNLDNTRAVIDWVGNTFKPGQVLFSLMSQFTPTAACAAFPELNRPLTEQEHADMYDYLMDSPIEDGFFQDLGSVSESFIPPFDLTGI